MVKWSSNSQIHENLKIDRLDPLNAPFDIFSPHCTVLSLQARYVEVSSFIVTHVVLVSHSVTQSVIESEPRRVISVPAEVLKIRGASKGK